MTELLDKSVFLEIEIHATELAKETGRLLSKHFGNPLHVEYKDEHENNPVTEVDKEAQEFLVSRILDRFPDHGILGEEDSGENDNEPAPDFVWVLDPLDGTKNFIGGLPIFASSIGILYRGRAIAGAIYVPWPNETKGAVFHAREGGGSFLGTRRLSIVDSKTSNHNKLTAIPAAFNKEFRFEESMKSKLGDLRITGSIAFEMAMATKGVFQYSINTGPRIWDVAAGTVILAEAGGAVLSAISDKTEWNIITSFEPHWIRGKTNFGNLRNWSSPILFGDVETVSLIASNLSRRTNFLSFRNPFSRSD